MGIGDWGLGIGEWGLGPITNTQSPNPHPQSTKYKKYADGGLGFGDWGLGIGPNPQSPIPNPQSPIPNPQYNYKTNLIESIINLINK